LCIGYQSGFTVYSLSGEQHPQCKYLKNTQFFQIYYLYSIIIKCALVFAALVHPDNQMLGFLAYNPVDALGAIELSRSEYLLVFNTLAVFVDSQGRKSRDREIMYP